MIQISPFPFHLDAALIIVWAVNSSLGFGIEPFFALSLSEKHFIVLHKHFIADTSVK